MRSSVRQTSLRLAMVLFLLVVGGTSTLAQSVSFNTLHPFQGTAG